ncbi:MAG: hypothetical protein PWP03_173 [Candidatus Woesearchaeota archaeon]|nr:hypothetical protein [Candidatus Woesearchaeota archaeon]MDN5327535.1 hypothetical protein [Candidatus Woesearchaeota archaeon]
MYVHEKMSKKAQGLSLNYVVVGVIALVVLLVIILIFTSGISPFHKTTLNLSNQKCEDIGHWENSKESCKDGEKPLTSGFSDALEPKNMGKICCVKAN